jgi:hypothetical protein
VKKKIEALIKELERRREAISRAISSLRILITGKALEEDFVYPTMKAHSKGPTKTQRRVLRAHIKKTCVLPTCKRVFRARRKDNVYCSKACRNSGQIMRMMKDPQAPPRFRSVAANPKKGVVILPGDALSRKE